MATSTPEKTTIDSPSNRHNSPANRQHEQTKTKRNRLWLTLSIGSLVVVGGILFFSGTFQPAEAKPSEQDPKTVPTGASSTNEKKEKTSPWYQPLTNLTGGWFQSRSKLPANIVTKPAEISDFRITINERGFLDSQNNEVLTCQVPGSTTIISIVEEGVSVNKGDVVVELDTSELEERIQQQEIDLTKAEAAFATAEQDLEIQKTQNASDIALAELSLELAELDYNKYIEGEYPQEKDKILGQIRLKEEELARKQEAYEFTKRLAKKGYRSQTDLEADRIAVTQAELALSVEEENLRVLEKFTSVRTIRELEANSRELARELDRVKRQATSSLSKAQAEYESTKLTLDVQKQKFEEWKKRLELCKLRAPQSGQVVYANDTRSRRGSSEPEIFEGATVRERQEILKIPDLTKMKIDARIHESKISQLDVGQKVLVRADARPGEVFNAEVASISSVPMSGSWPNYDIKEYEVDINLTDPPEKVSRLRPGISAQFEVVVEDRDDVLQIPVQSVVQIGNKHHVWVVDGKDVTRREVIVGSSNETDIEVKDGVNKGEEVVMSPRSTFVKEIAKLSEQYAKEKKMRGLAAAPDTEQDEEQNEELSETNSETPDNSPQKPKSRNKSEE